MSLVARHNLLTGAARSRPPRGWVKAWDCSFNEALADTLRSGGNQYDGYADGPGWWEQGYGTQSTTYDSRGVAGQSNNFQPAADYPTGWPAAWKPCAITDARFVMSGGTCAAAGIDAVVPYISADTRYTNYGCIYNTRNSFKFKGDFYIEALITMSGTLGSWGNLWTWTDDVDIITSPSASSALFEIDIFEYAPADTDNARYMQQNIHGHETAGGTYNVVSGVVDMGYDLSTGPQKVAVLRQGDIVTWFVNDRKTNSVRIPSTWIAKDDWSYLILSLDVSDSGAWPGTYAGGTVEMVTDYIKVFVPASNAHSHVYTNNYPSGLGPDRFSGRVDLAVAGVSPGTFFETCTSSIGTTVGGQTPAILFSAGGLYNGRVYFGNAATDNDNNPHNEAGTTATNCGFVAGVTYRVKFVYDYGSSGTGLFWVQAGLSGTASWGTLAGTTATMWAGGTYVANVEISTDDYGRKVLQFDYTPPETGGSWLEMGPYTENIGQSLIWYDVEARPYL